MRKEKLKEAVIIVIFCIIITPIFMGFVGCTNFLSEQIKRWSVQTETETDDGWPNGNVIIYMPTENVD